MENNSTNASVTLDLWSEYVLIPNILNVALGVPLNLSVLGLIAAGMLVKVSEIPALNQTLCELGICIQSIAIILHFYIPNKHLESVVKFLNGLIIAGRLLFMTLVCVSCYIAVAHPVTFQRIKPRRNQLATSGVCWLAVLAFCVSNTFLSHRKGAIVAFIMTTISIAVQLICFVRILGRLVQPSPGAREPGRAGMNGAKFRAFVIIATLLASAVFALLPIVIVSGMSNFLTYQEYIVWISISTYFSVVGGFVHPLLWVCRAEKLPCIRAP